MNSIKVLFATALFLLLNLIAKAQSIPFDKAHFPNQKDQLKDAKKNFEDGKDAFELGKKEYDYLLQQYVATHKIFPVSRHDYGHSGDIYFKQALPLLERAQAFNPNNDELNFELGFTYFVFILGPKLSTKVRTGCATNSLPLLHSPIFLFTSSIKARLSFPLVFTYVSVS